MRDFRQRVVQRRPERSEVDDLLKRGLILKALRRARDAGVVIQQEAIDARAKAMYNAGRAGELLSLIGSVEVSLPFDAQTLLSRAFDAHDYHNFLKQAHRLRITAGLEDKIRAAIDSRPAPEAESWQRKFTEIVGAGN